MKQIIYSLAALLVLLIFGRYLRPTPADSGYDLNRFAELPVQVGGRIKPLDSVARNTLLVLAARQKVETIDGQTLSPIEWFLDLTMRPERADTHPVFKIEFPDDLGFDGLAQPGKRHYSFNDLRPHFETINQQFREIDPEPKKRDAYQRQIAELNNGLSLYHRVMHSLHPIGDAQRLDQLADEYRSYLSLLQPAMAELRKQQAGEQYDTELVKTFLGFGEDYLRLSQTAHLRVIPPPAPIDPMDDWLNLGDELLNVIQTGQLSPYAMSYASLTMAYRAGDATTFNQTLADLRQRVAADFPNDIGRVHFERLFNGFKPFAIAIELYILVFLFVCISWLRWPSTLGNAAFWILCLAFILHTFGLAARMYIQDRPPVTNLYSSAVFVGWGAVLLGAFLEKFHRNGIGAAMAALVGFSTLIIAHHLAMTGDTLEMMRAVLDSNFWLATHVVIITLGYSAMFFAGALAIAFVILGVGPQLLPFRLLFLVGIRIDPKSSGILALVYSGLASFSDKFDKDAARSLCSMVYGITCFAALFSLVGTILGGIWADQSWGRFWGWDPKENGALMIVIMCAITLHARWGGIVRERGIMALAILGNIVTAWSWFGTNLLGVGLHSYGFTDSGFLWMCAFALSQLLCIALALLPLRYWRSEFGQASNG